MSNEDLDDVLKKILMSPQVEAATIVSIEGLPIASALPQGVDETRMAAMTAALHSLANQSILEMNKGEFDQLSIKGADGYILVRQAGSNALLTVSTPRIVNLDSIFFDSAAVKAYEKIISIGIKESVNRLAIERKYLPEILSKDVLEISKNDGLPILKPFVLKYFLLKEIKTKLYGNVIKFSLLYLKNKVEIEKTAKQKENEREEKDEKEHLFKLFQKQGKNE
ncbi:MAG: roadblock/LC7 domain-containing protein [Promethearchaeota archaeon]